MVSPTKKQLDYIRSIEELTGVMFCGQTKDDAAQYISDNVEEFKRLEELEELSEELMYEDCCDRW